MRVSILFATFSLGTMAMLAQSRTFSGEIMDSQCAAVMHSHARMMQGVDAKNAKECTEKCVHMGGKYAFLDSSGNTAYQLDDQEKAAAFAGQKVTVKGTLDSGTKTIHVESIAGR